MTTLLALLAVALLVGTIGTLFAGWYSMGIGGEYDELHSNRLMVKRVAWQAATLAAAALFLLAR